MEDIPLELNNNLMSVETGSNEISKGEDIERSRDLLLD